MDDLLETIENGVVKIKNITKEKEYEVKVELSPEEIKVIKYGGKLNYTKAMINKMKNINGVIENV